MPASVAADLLTEDLRHLHKAEASLGCIVNLPGCLAPEKSTDSLCPDVRFQFVSWVSSGLFSQQLLASRLLFFV